jgi:riboflavin kinase / FMN adenylyltransferase
MEIFTQLADLPPGLTNTAIALGTFDGMHIGHKKIVQRVIQFAKLSGGTSVMFTFSNHPRSVLFPDHAPKLLMSQGKKAELLETLGLDMLVTIPFTTDFLKFSPDEFVQLLLKCFQPALLVVGANYCYGYKGQGTSKTLLSAGLENGFAVEVSPIITVAGHAVSSTTIRKLIEDGQLKRAALFLGQLYELEGPVVDGDKRGRVLGFPTANIFIESTMLLPSDGVYAVQFILNNQVYQGLANVGVNPTFRGEERRLEVFLLNFSGDLYGEKVRVAFLDKIRHEKVFQNGERLVEQIQQDIAVAKRIFSLR